MPSLTPIFQTIKNLSFFVLISLAYVIPTVALTAEPFELNLRSLENTKGTENRWKQVQASGKWKPTDTAVVICDMWDYHHCLNATMRVGEIAPRMNQVVSAMRDRGAFVVHAPSSCMDFYKDHPARKRAMSASKAINLPGDINQWCNEIPGEEMKLYPIDQSDGGEDDDLALHEKWANHLSSLGRNPRSPWKRQIDTIKIDSKRDIISDNGNEIWNSMEQRGIKNVVLVGVHTNMCVLGRPFGLRQMAKNGRNVVLMRDMTDTMYNPVRKPYASHYRGTDLIVEHIEKYVAPTITSDQVIGGKPFTFKWDVPTKVVVAIAEPEYQTWDTLPVLAKKIWTKQRGFDLTIVIGDPEKHTIPGLVKALKDADVLVLSARRQALPKDQLQAIRNYLDAGKPLLAIRTSSHAFFARGKGPEGHAEWEFFDPEVLGGNYQGHYKNTFSPAITAVESDTKHPILEGIDFKYSSGGSLYKAKPLAKTATPLLMGKIEGEEAEPVAWVNTFGKSKVFYTSLGHVSDFKEPAFEKLMWNSMEWMRVLPSDTVVWNTTKE
ncbi:MAG: ThuA domain-containing protein [Pirellulales bacterium]